MMTHTEIVTDLAPIDCRGYGCICCGHSLNPTDNALICPDCGAVFCEDCVNQGCFEEHICEYEDPEDYEEEDN